MVSPPRAVPSASGPPVPAPPVVALVASAGGLGAITSVLSTLPAEYGFAVVVAQHMGGHGRMLADILRRRLTLPVGWAADGEPLRPGTVVVCPARTVMELLPDGTVSLAPATGPGSGGVHDALLTSLAGSIGERAVAVVLSGMGQDGLAGAQAIRRAGGTVIAQSEQSAEHASMPLAVAEAGVANLVLDLPEIGPVLWDVAQGGLLPRGAQDRPDAGFVFAGAGEVATLARKIDWSQTPLGPVRQWPAQLVTLVRTVLDSPVGMCLLWGPDLLQFYNDAYRLVMGAKHPAGLGQANRECWPEVWHLNEPRYRRALAGESVSLKDALYPTTRHGDPENAWFDLTFSPLHDDGPAPAGVLVTAIETTHEVLARRRLDLLSTLAGHTRKSASGRAALESFIGALGDDAPDIPFAAAYLNDPARQRAELVAAVGTPAGGPLAPHTALLSWRRPKWPLAELVATGEPVLATDLAHAFRGVTVGAGDDEPGSAMLFPLGETPARAPAGILLLGVSPRLPLDEPYRHFLGLVAAQATAALTDAVRRRRQSDRIDQLAELDRTKTQLLSTVSHELRTPLTLLLAPLDDLAAPVANLAPHLRAQVDIAARNARRLLGMVESLLDFSQLEAGRLRARSEPTDLAQLTEDIASTFRGATDHAGITLEVDCPPLSAPVPVDPEMWEKIVANLLSNAVKFTFAGTITVTLRELPQHAQLTVRDTGVGIPEDELARVFTRFHRAPATRSRTHDGAGIGLALVHELARLLHGRVKVRSTVGEGTEFTVWILRRKSPDAEKPASGRIHRATAVALAEAAEHWDTHTDDTPAPAWPDRARLLVVDDNRDMRDYLTRLLSPNWHVHAVGDAQRTLESARRDRPDLIVADVMMPEMDGLELARRLRADPALQSVPLIMLSARAGEEATVEGLTAGADDYLVKPFAPSELVARVAAQLERRRVQEVGDRRFRALVAATFDAVYRMNPDWSEMRGLDGRGFIADTTAPSHSWLDSYISPDDQPGVLAAIDEAVRTKSVFDAVHRVRRVDGTLGWTHSRAVPLCDDNGEIVEWVGTATEVPGPAARR
ncbi:MULTISPECIES: chemotaxis protein CheB [unclassified Amycolatopsis]|uniref:chemotaxis protein CheB n=1 Tax=unclassified Amycolatopsis TaxID=2618356 RepID=UPI002876DE61|nr:MULTISPECIES: chemotaxis protein CheB [unclassified Amycolatopsis]MDS0135845.1 response regulator [Amycolatopsis sp. 505]MDS0149675.1 response regulator [Amycolatopsis sp. CM201R]